MIKKSKSMLPQKRFTMDTVNVAIDTVQFCCHGNTKRSCIAFVAVGYYELLVVLAISEATAAMETVDDLLCCDGLGWCVAANGEGGITEFE